MHTHVIFYFKFMIHGDFSLNMSKKCSHISEKHESGNVYLPQNANIFMVTDHVKYKITDAIIRNNFIDQRMDKPRKQ